MLTSDLNLIDLTEVMATICDWSSDLASDAYLRESDLAEVIDNEIYKFLKYKFMRNFYTAILAMAAFACCQNASAESLTLVVDHPEAVTVTYNPSSGASQSISLHEGENLIEFEIGSYGYGGSLSFSQNTGWKIVSISAGEYDNVSLYNGNGSLYLYSSADGKKYTLTSYNLDERRTASCTVNVTDDASRIRATYADGTTLSLQNGENTVKFIPDEETPLKFIGTDGKTLYQVIHNGTRLTNTVSNYDMTIAVPVADGDNVELTAAWPEKDAQCFFFLPEGMETDIITEVKNIDSYNTLDFTEEGFSAPLGSRVQLSLNYDKYSIENVLVNDQSVSANSGYATFRITDEIMTIEVLAHLWGDINFSLNVDEPSRVKVYASADRSKTSPYELVAGDNALTISETDGSIVIEPAVGCQIVSLTDSEGNDILSSLSPYGENSISLAEGTVVNVVSKEIEYDAAWALYIHNFEDNIGWDTYYDRYSAYYSEDQTRRYVYLTEGGHHVVGFDSTASAQYMIYAMFSTESGGYILCTDNEIEPASTSTYFYKYFYPTDGQVIRLFGVNDNPQLYDISFTINGNQAQEAELVTDFVKEHAIDDENNWHNGIQAVTGAHVAISVPEGDEIVVVKVDGNEVEADENGKYCFFVSNNHNVEITSTPRSSDALESVEAAVENTPKAVYNLQGIKVLDSDANIGNLPSGIYIVNGQKRVVR